MKEDLASIKGRDEKGIVVEYVPKEKLYPAFGRCFRTTRTIWIRSDLPFPAQRFLYWHEMHHLTDTPEEGFFKVEWKANLSGIRHELWGAIVVIWLSVSSWDRWKLYIARIGQAITQGGQG